MTYDDFVDKYGEVEVTFSSYYKYVFAYKGLLDNEVPIVLYYGGTHDDVYRYEVNAGEVIKIKNLGFNSAKVGEDSYSFGFW